jgi:hypothetical protein
MQDGKRMSNHNTRAAVITSNTHSSTNRTMLDCDSPAVVNTSDSESVYTADSMNDTVLTIYDIPFTMKYFCMNRIDKEK